MTETLMEQSNEIKRAFEKIKRFQKGSILMKKMLNKELQKYSAENPNVIIYFKDEYRYENTIPVNYYASFTFGTDKQASDFLHYLNNNVFLDYHTKTKVTEMPCHEKIVGVLSEKFCWPFFFATGDKLFKNTNEVTIGMTHIITTSNENGKEKEADIIFETKQVEAFLDYLDIQQNSKNKMRQLKNSKKNVL